MTDVRRSFCLCTLVALFLFLAPLTFSQTITTADVVGWSRCFRRGCARRQGDHQVLRIGRIRTETTNGQGQYRFPLMKPGDYEVSAPAKGLKSNIFKITLLVGQAQEANITMKPEGTSTTVEVTATAAVLQTENANLETNFNKSSGGHSSHAGRRSHNAGHDCPRHSRECHRRLRQHECQRHSRRRPFSIPSTAWIRTIPPTISTTRAPATTCWEPTQWVKWPW